MTPALKQEVIEALTASVRAGDGHYRHHDPMGTAGANCPACMARREANNLVYNVLRKLKEVDDG